MTVQVASCSAAQLFSGALLPEGVKREKRVVDSEGNTVSGALTIPEYQRPYCWRDSQLKSLLKDIRVHQEQTPKLSYYLGSLILHQTDEKLNIIDGQQRITTLALMNAVLAENKPDGSDGSLVDNLSFEHPTSQQQIKHNLSWLIAHSPDWQGLIDFAKLQFTLVITQSEDDAYRFFETQNTGGVRLGGPDIIKAHHLRAVDTVYQAQFAAQWEALGSLNETVSALLKGRYWQGLNNRELPSHKQVRQVRDVIVQEFAEKTGKEGDVAFGRLRRDTGLAGDVTHQFAQQGYDVRQPLNEGINSIRYLSYFKGLYEQYWKTPNLPHLQGYQDFVEWMKELDGCGYLQGLYEACLMLYISQFGENQLKQAAAKLFRVVYSRRISNQKAVRENSIPSFVKEHPVLDWIALSYTPEQCFGYLDSFVLKVDGSNLDKNSVKKRYMDKVNERFSLGLIPEQYKESFAEALTRKVAGGLK